MIILDMFWIFGGIVLLFGVMAGATRLVVSAFERTAFGLSTKGKVALAAILVALSTSLPELFVTTASVVEGTPEVALGMLLGSNVADLSIIIGGATLLGGSLSIVGNYWRWELAAAFLAGIAPILLMMDGSLTRLDGMILLVIYLIYLSDLVIDGRKKRLEKAGATQVGIISRMKKDGKTHRGKFGLLAGAGVIALLISGDLLVRLSSSLALGVGIPVGVIGLLIVSVGTSLPELFLSTGAIVKKDVALVLGNLLGSVVTNATLIVGLLAVLSPFHVERVESYALVNVAFVVIFGCFWLFTSTNRRLLRREGLILVGLFMAFVGLQLLLSPSLR